MIRNYTLGVVALFASLALAACSGGGQESTADQRQAEATAAQTNEIDRKVGMPAVPNGTERMLVRDIYEMRDDPNLKTYSYVQGLDGKLRCFGKSIGFGVPYSAQFSNPERVLHGAGANGRSAATIPQPEPNGLFVPDGLSATFVLLIDPATGEPKPVYTEPTLTVSPFPLTGPAVAAPC